LIYSSEAINDGKRDIDRIVQIAGRDCQWRVAKFTAEESKEQRAEILGSFRAGDIDAIVAIRCLDEGVDIPQTKTAYILASSTNPRQFIQRRGRVLRQYDGKGHASIYDFIAIPPLDKLGEDEETFNIEKSMVERELDRINEFAEISENYGHTLSTLRDIRKKLKLLGA
jgi:superfamily II DNA or RNA helicase